MNPMQLPAGTVLNVSLQWDAETQIRVGRLGLRDRRTVFEFDPVFLLQDLEISPFRFHRQLGVIESQESIFDNLPGVFADSLPDGWGRLLLDRRARQLGVPPATLTPLDRLAHVGRNGIGALIYEPEFATDAQLPPVDLDHLARASKAVLADSSDAFLDELRRLGGSPQGARPKALVQIENDSGNITDALQDHGPGWRHWIVKFAAQDDVRDIGPLELAYAQMAVAAGIEMPVTQLLPSRIGPGYFAAQRFDRSRQQRLHTLTAAGLLHVDYRMPSLDYLDLAKATVRLTQDYAQSEAMLRRMVFNVLAHNRDDHAKQFSFLMNRQGQWRLSPAYDLTFSQGMGGEHITSIAGKGKHVLRADLAQVAVAAGVRPEKGAEIEGEVRSAVARWREFAAQAGVTRKTAARVAGVLQGLSAAAG